MEYREITPDIQDAVTDIVGSIIVSRGRVHHIERCAGFVAMADGDIRGVITYSFSQSECEIVSLDSKTKGQGIGSKLIELVIQKAEGQGSKRVWLITSNDNTRAIRFYQRRGFDLRAIHYDAITEARKLKPSIPLHGYDHIPVRHEIEFEYALRDLITVET
ncbi:Acetyltransferase (GNAT) family protein [Paenibacillus sp. 1_12]|uniref:GNAT family N-acetyltransferase n=1 Tax=Paenibacillus sp. 1_12 TaxID=1566278 RepID=UPI0008E117E9|nr:GNAT family N-acetyltransferase [Paenibacillus sp. 1_12]SFL74381.1 Acetyltransferase (GNAT) family protein [Paenibacillus sp. 1_12]